MMKAKVTSRISLAVMLAASLPTYANPIGGFPGRTVNATENSGTAVEAFYRRFSDANTLGIRLSHRYNNDILVFADAAQTKIEPDVDNEFESDDLSGNAFGVGAMYFKPELIEGYDAAISASYHTGDLSTDRSRFTTPDGELSSDRFGLNSDITVITLQLIISSRKPLAANGLLWYAGAMGQRRQQAVSVDGDANVPGIQADLNQLLTTKDSDTHVGATVGVVLPTSFGHVYAAAERIEDSSVGVGVRYNLK